MQKLEFVQKSETDKILCDFKRETDHLISTRRPELLKVNEKKRNFQIVNFPLPADHRVKIKENEKRYK